MQSEVFYALTLGDGAARRVRQDPMAHVVRGVLTCLGSGQPCRNFSLEFLCGSHVLFLLSPLYGVLNSDSLGQPLVSTELLTIPWHLRLDLRQLYFTQPLALILLLSHFDLLSHCHIHAHVDKRLRFFSCQKPMRSLRSFSIQLLLPCLRVKAYITRGPLVRFQ